MRILFSITFLMLLSSCLLPAQGEDNSVYKLPETPNTVTENVITSTSFMLAGTDSGLYKVLSDGTSIPLWTEGKVSKIIKATIENNDYSINSSEHTDSDSSTRWFFLTSQGIITSTDLNIFEYRNEGLPFLTIKQLDGKDIFFTKQPAQLKDLEIHPQNPEILVTATKEAVYLTKNGGKTWTSIGSAADSTTGIKAVAIADINVAGTGKPAVQNPDGTITAAVPPQTELVAFMAHSIFGFSYCRVAEGSKKAWKDCNGGFENMKTQVYPDEFSDIMPVVFTGADGFPVTEIFISQTYMPRLYRFDWNTKRGQLLYSGKEPADTIDGLFWDGTKVIYSRPGEIAAYNPTTKQGDFAPIEFSNWKQYFSSIGIAEKADTLYTAWLPDAKDEKKKGITLNELWLLFPDDCNNKYAAKALNKKSIYVQAHKLMTKQGIDQYRKIIRDNKLDSMVIDMKDDYGGIRFEPKDPLIREKGYVSRYKIDLDTFVPQMKEDGVYLIARIVTFKDKNLASYGNGKYAVWDKATNRPWKGISGYEKVKDEAGNETGETKTTYYDENWVDPYSPEVWEYFVHIAQELISRGFDEIQFDYIRFPTDGKNLANATFRYKSPGMDKESALLSFLSYARKNIDAPIGIDIYGANGWYRSGTRTGQDVEQLAEYVDVVCPMFYPSHFENSFLNYAPNMERPYRIYYYGTYRNTVIGRNKLIIRPWIQAFYLNVLYDRNFYDKNYVLREIYGVRDSVNRGYMYWNGMCRYDDISPDVGDSKYPWNLYEADPNFRKPALSGGSKFKANHQEIEMPAQQPQTEPALTQTGASASAGKIETSGSIPEQENRQQKTSFPKASDIKKLWQAYDASQGA